MTKPNMSPVRNARRVSPDLTSESESSSSSDSDESATEHKRCSSTHSAPRRRSLVTSSVTWKLEEPRRGSAPSCSSNRTRRVSTAPVAASVQHPAGCGSPRRASDGVSSTTSNPRSGTRRKSTLLKISKTAFLEHEVSEVEVKAHVACGDERHKAFIEELTDSSKVRFIRAMFDEKLAELDWATSKCLGELMDKTVAYLVSVSWERLKQALEAATCAQYAQVQADKQTQISKEMQVGYLKEVTLMRDRVNPKRNMYQVDLCEVELWEPLNDLDHVTRALVVACVEEKLKGVITSSTGESILQKEKELQRNIDEAQAEVTRLQAQCRQMGGMLSRTQAELEQTTMSKRKTEALLALAQAGMNGSEPGFQTQGTETSSLSRRPSYFIAKQENVQSNSIMGAQPANIAGMMCLGTSLGARPRTGSFLVPKSRSSSIFAPRRPSMNALSLAESMRTSTIVSIGDTLGSRRPSVLKETNATSEDQENHGSMVDVDLASKCSSVALEMDAEVRELPAQIQGQHAKLDAAYGSADESRGCHLTGQHSKLTVVHDSADESTECTEDSGVTSEALTIESLCASDTMSEHESRRQVLGFMSARELADMALANGIDREVIFEALIDENSKHKLVDIIVNAEQQTDLCGTEKERCLRAQEERRRNIACRLRSCRRAARESQKDPGKIKSRASTLDVLPCSELTLERDGTSDEDCGPVTTPSKLARKGPVLSAGKAGIGWRKAGSEGTKSLQKLRVLLGVGAAFTRELTASPSSGQDTGHGTPASRLKGCSHSRCSTSTPTSEAQVAKVHTLDSLPSARASTPGATASLPGSRVRTSDSLISLPIAKSTTPSAKREHLEVNGMTSAAAVVTSLPNFIKSPRAARISQEYQSGPN